MSQYTGSRHVLHEKSEAQKLKSKSDPAFFKKLAKPAVQHPKQKENSVGKKIVVPNLGKTQRLINQDMSLLRVSFAYHSG